MENYRNRETRSYLICFFKIEKNVKEINDMDKLLNELQKFIEEIRKNNLEQPFLSDFENGYIEGRNDVIDDLERLVNKLNLEY